MRKRKIFLFLIGFLGTLFLGFHFALAQSATIYISPKIKNLSVGDTLDISVGISPQNAKIDTVAGTLSLSPNLSCQNISISGDGVIPASSPSCSSPSFGLGITGGTSENKILFTIKIRAEKEGTGSVSVVPTEVLQEGEDVSYSVSNGTYTVSIPCSCGAWSSWKSGSCGGGGCASNERLQTRNRICTPSGCNREKETQCVIDSACEKKITTPAQATILPPSNLKAQDVPDDDGRAIKIFWNASSTRDISGYFILRKSPSDAYYRIIKTVGKSTLSFVDGTCEPGQTYDYQVVAYRGDWNTRSSWPQKATATAIDNLKEEKNKEESGQPFKLEVLVDENGKTTSNLIREILEGKIIISIAKGTEVIDNENSFSKEITIIKLIGENLKSPDDLVNIGIAIPKSDVFLPGAIFDFKPDGIKFNPEVKISFQYDLSLMPKGFNEDDFVIKFQTDSKWISLPTKIDKEKKLVSANVSHFSLFGIFLEKKSIEKKSEAKITPVIYPVSYQDNVNWMGITGGILAFLAVLSFTLYYFKSPNIIEGLKKEYPHIFEELKNKKTKK